MKPIRYRLKLTSWTAVREAGQASPRILSSPEPAALLALDFLRDHDDDKGHFFAVLLNAQNHYLMHTLVSSGTQSASLVHPREVLGLALWEGAASLLLVHNHPSGDPTPLREDVRPTRQLADAARLLDIRLHDHIIVGNGSGRWVSLAVAVERGLREAAGLEQPSVVLEGQPHAERWDFHGGRLAVDWSAAATPRTRVGRGRRSRWHHQPPLDEPPDPCASSPAPGAPQYLFATGSS